LFFPINPDNEEASWERLPKEGLDRFFADFSSSLIPRTRFSRASIFRGALRQRRQGF